VELIAPDAALLALEHFDPRKSRLVAMLEGKDTEAAGRWAFISSLREARQEYTRLK
jgi:hypothetical protein